MVDDETPTKAYMPSALFVYNQECQHFIDALTSNQFGTLITPASFEDFSENFNALLKDFNHVVVSGPLNEIKSVLNLAVVHKFSVGIIPMESQRNLIKSLELDTDIEKDIELALRQDAPYMDLITCNGIIVLSKASIGRVPLLDETSDLNLLSFFAKAWNKFKDMKLLRFSFITANEKKVVTAASGCMILQHSKESLASKLIQSDNSARDGSISLVISSPYSIINYFKFLIQTWHRTAAQKKLPSGIGYIKSSQITIESDTELSVFIDGNSETQTPVRCETIKDAVKINLGAWLEEENATVAKEKIRIDNIPDEQELLKSVGKKIPFFSYASEDRFRDLFISLRDDAKINSTYIVLMLLSTALATFGLYLNSAAVIIGAMLLAPLMSPIVSVSMALLRYDKILFDDSVKKIGLGIAIAIVVSTVIALMFPHKPVTPEMLGRANPTILDLAVAILSGVAAAYSKSFKDVVQSLAGVAIAVALVPPLAVAGVGLGQADLSLFGYAFLLFCTNLVGIILAAVFTFRVLGYSSVVRNKRGLLFVTVSLVVITIPLYLSYNQIVNTLAYQKNMEKERFLVNDKYIIIRNVRLTHTKDRNIVDLDILTRDTLSRRDLDTLKQKIQSQYEEKIIIRSRVRYIL